MNFLLGLPCLLLAAAPAPQAPGLEQIFEAGGTLSLDGTIYRFEPSGIDTLPARPGLPALLRLTGRLVPEDPAQAIDFQLSLLKKDSMIYMLRLLRNTPSGYPDSWSATGKTRARFTKLEDRSGGRVEITCSGPLNGVVGKRQRTATWQGSLWAVLP